jgi:hypothetical protein
VVGFVLFSLFYGYCVYRSTRSVYLTIAFGFQFTMLDGNILVPQHAFTALFLSALPVLVGTKEHARRRSFVGEVAETAPLATGQAMRFVGRIVPRSLRDCLA